MEVVFCRDGREKQNEDSRGFIGGGEGMWARLIKNNKQYYYKVLTKAELEHSHFTRL